MIDRSYLPFKAAREYRDRGMVKWMGFFLSEHTSALSSIGDKVDFSLKMPEEEKVFQLSQVYVNKLTILCFTTSRKEPYCGQICDLSDRMIHFRSEGRVHEFGLDEILSLELVEHAQ
ncbi:hypothetical protein QP568_06265 [Propionimicrobium lymphophilum]|uniref:YolD-like protein n=1 Tax=Propionimicrobium lymphophilum ACS-093-V-SCH5 TaxID=883161 RepID=S2WLD8_9ACTN|nr:hypothetical protein [Propionimicrobium lymphophilum]EPD33467.1 hypothetical protein HMPREF9306_01007 [Propionimicrobium lymphophilum ACS-093-V-SCH5]MDK7709846.1 hypothetical protein [Propionimicrobium lymphophilum]MDK7733892.1 hypothetical protein [Propionimicrobium lymphophilum]